MITRHDGMRSIHTPISCKILEPPTGRHVAPARKALVQEMTLQSPDNLAKLIHCLLLELKRPDRNAKQEEWTKGWKYDKASYRLDKASYRLDKVQGYKKGERKRKEKDKKEVNRCNVLTILAAWHVQTKRARRKFSFPQQLYGMSGKYYLIMMSQTILKESGPMQRLLTWEPVTYTANGLAHGFLRSGQGSSKKKTHN